MKHGYIRYLILFVFCMFVSPLITHASCDYQRMAELSKIASNVQFSYNYRIEDNYPIFTVDISNVTNDIYVVDDFDNVFNGSNTLHDYQFVNTITYSIYSNDISCRGEKIIDRIINLPTYNKYSNYDACKGFSDYSLCQMWSNVWFENDEDFFKAINKYKNKEKTDKQSTTDKQSLLNSMFDLIHYNYIWIIIISLIIVSFFAFVRRKKE